MRRHSLILLVTLAIGVIASTALRLVSAADSTSLARATDVLLERDADLLLGIVPTRTTLAGLFRQQGIDGPQSAALIAAIGSSFDLRRMRAGQPYTIDRLLDGRVRRFEYEIDADRRLLLSRASDAAPRFVAAIERIAKVTTVVAIEGEINRESSSLTAAIDKAGERIELALGLADVFSGEIDFSSDLQPGDHFRLVVERHTREGKPAGYGAILAAEFFNDGRNLTAVRFTPDGASPGYYDTQGRSLKRFFLKSPLKFEPRVTSSFSRSRLHPILGYARAHNGVDYHAPTGAPVASVAPGVVTMAGWTSGGGRTVRVRHANGYESEYLHLSAISVRAGARVGQGDLIGRVGATGLATAPHLHYGLRKNGSYVNPILEHRNMPPGEPVPAGLLSIFNAERDHVLGLLQPTALRAANN
ncbi:MAG: peptidoglycan DD-metalloendopeptidase family protein [Vicinamibacterales bacterium]